MARAMRFLTVPTLGAIRISRHSRPISKTFATESLGINEKPYRAGRFTLHLASQNSDGVVTEQSAPRGRISDERRDRLRHFTRNHMGQRDAFQNRPLGGPQRDPDLLQGGSRANVSQIFRATAAYVG